VPLISAGIERRGPGRADLVQHIDVVPDDLDLVRAGTGACAPIAEAVLEAPTGCRSVVYSRLVPRYHFGWSGLTALTDDRYR